MCKRLNLLVLAGLILGISGPAMAGMIVAGELLVDLRAEDLAYGVAADWVNHGTLGVFTPQGLPVVEDVDGRKAVTFNTSQDFFVGPTSVPGIEGAETRSIEVWAYNPSITPEETLVHWSQRGGPARTNMAFNYGNNDTWGAAAHWDEGDMGWGQHAPAPAAGTWWHLAYTYDGTTVRLYVNGELDTSKVMTLNTYAGCPIRIAAQGDTTGQGINPASAFLGSIAEVRIHDGLLSPSDVANNFKSKPTSLPAQSPIPSKGATDVHREGVLRWTPGQFAATHDVYFSTSFDDVNTASRNDAKDVLASKGQTGTTFDPPGLLDYGQTYYWRVDEVNTAPDFFIYKGDIWSFTAETYGDEIEYPAHLVKATASSYSNVLAQPINTIDRSGLNVLDQHSTSSTQMWMSKKNVTPIWIQYEFDAVYSLHEMWVWNQNQMTEPDNGVGAKDVIIEVSTDGTAWTALGAVHQFAQGTGEPNYVHNTTVEFGGISAKYVKLTILNNWADGTKQAGLSEVRFFYVRVKAFSPTPATGAKDVAVDSVLNWRPGRTAVSHEVYLGTDPNGLSKVGTSTDHSYSLASAGVEYDRTYYWKVNEVEPLKTWDGDVWSFSTPGTFIVDDFENYNDNCNRVYYTWIDGYGATTSAECGGVTIPGNGSGAAVGNSSAPYAERTNSHGGRQSMPLFYDNAGVSSYSEATRTFTAPQDWVQGGIKTLVLYFYGASDNAAGQLYVKVNNTKVVYNGKSDALAIPMWRQWNVDLASMGGALRSVGTLTIGVSGAGKGRVLIDDILLYREAPAVSVPVNPGTTGLAAYYALDGDVKDGSGKGLNGTANGDPAYLPSQAGMGQAMVFDGINDHVDLPIGNLISTLTSATFASWANVDLQVAAAWPRIFDFGKGNTDYIQLTPHQGTDGPLTCDIRVNNVETRFAAARILPTGWHHVAVVVDGAAMTIKVYQDGTVVASGVTPNLPKDLGVTNQNWLGRSQWTADAYLIGQLDEFRIYNRALSEGEVRYLAGDR